MFDGRWRGAVESGIRPVGTALRRTGVTADHLTIVGLVLAAATAWAIGAGHLGLGLVLFISAAVPDLLDGAVAKASGTASQRGAFFDSVADRVTDALVLGGMGWYLASAESGHWAMLPFALLGASSLISYERAKAESLGIAAKGGLMERAERIIALCVALLFSDAMIPILFVMLALTLVTAVQRFAKVWKVADAPPRRMRRARPARAARPEHRWEGRWEARREARRELRDRRAERRGRRPTAARRARAGDAPRRWRAEQLRRLGQRDQRDQRDRRDRRDERPR